MSLMVLSLKSQSCMSPSLEICEFNRSLESICPQVQLNGDRNLINESKWSRDYKA